MDRLAFTASAAITEQTIARQQLVNELANMSTVGFKRSYDMALQSITAEGPGFSSRIQPQAVAKDLIRLEGGTVMATGRALDVAMNGKAVLGVSASDGTLSYTRRGDLRVNALGSLETGNGNLVRGEGGATINVPPGFVITINPDGNVVARDPALPGNARGQTIGRLMLRDASTAQLARRADGLFEVAGQPSGTELPGGSAMDGVTPGALEGSNVTAVQAMVRLMDHSRSFEQQIKIIKESRQIDESGATMLRPTT
jgi:flagellar basal-body rod protein FlgF